jgi:hypothetical protein
MPGQQRKTIVNHSGQDSDAIKYQIETDNLAQELKKKMGLKPVKKVNSEGQEEIVWKETSRAWANQEGIENIVGVVRGYSDKINQLSDYDPRQIERLMEQVHKAVARDIAENWEEYDIGKRGNAENIIELVTNIVWSTFNAAKDGKKMEITGDSTEAKTVTKNDDSGGSGRFNLFGD